MNRPAYTLVEETRPRLGLVVLQADETIEDEFRRLFDPDDVRLHITRIPSGTALNPQSIHEMAGALPGAASLLPKAAHFDAVGYACTSGTTLIGADRVRTLVQSACKTRAVTDPLTAAIAAFKHLQIGRIGIVSPYVPPVSEALRLAFEHAGIAVPHIVSFGEEIEANVARIAPASIKNAACNLAAETDLNGLFLSCTNLRTLAILDVLQTELGCPVLSSNLVLAWHLAWLADKPQLISLSE